MVEILRIFTWEELKQEIRLLLARRLNLPPDLIKKMKVFQDEDGDVFIKVTMTHD